MLSYVLISYQTYGFLTNKRKQDHGKKYTQQQEGAAINERHPFQWNPRNRRQLHIFDGTDVDNGNVPLYE